MDDTAATYSVGDNTNISSNVDTNNYITPIIITSQPTESVQISVDEQADVHINIADNITTNNINDKPVDEIKTTENVMIYLHSTILLITC